MDAGEIVSKVALIAFVPFCPPVTFDSQSYIWDGHHRVNLEGIVLFIACSLLKMLDGSKDGIGGEGLRRSLLASLWCYVKEVRRWFKESGKDFWDSPLVLSMNHSFFFSIRNTNYSQTLPPSYLLVFHGYILLPQCLNHPHLSNTHLPHQKPCVAHWYTHQFESIPPK